MTSMYAIAAMAENRVIGKDGKIPWYLPEDLQYFKEKTLGHTVLMGRKTYDSFPASVRPLPGRKNIVLTRSKETRYPEGVRLIHDAKAFLSAVKEGEELSDVEQLWIIGGQSLYEISLPFLDELYITKVHGSPEGDTWFPEFESEFVLVSERESESCTYCRYQRKV